MRRLLLFVFSVLISAPLFAQNWQTVNPNDTVYFKCTNANNYGAVRMITVDSVRQNNGDSLYYFYKTMRAPDLGKCVDTLAPSWMGSYCIRHSDGTELYINEQNDTISIHTWAAIADAWAIGKDTLGNIYYAAVANIDTATIDGVLDSVKLLTIQATNGGNPVTSYYDTFTVKWSKNHGWVKTLDWYAFPNATTQPYTWGAQLMPFSFERLPMAFNAKDFSQPDLLWKYTPGNEWFCDNDVSPLYSPIPASNKVYTYDSVISSSVINNYTISATLKEIKRVVTYQLSNGQWVVDSNYTTTNIQTVTITASSYHPVTSQVSPDLKPSVVGMTPFVYNYTLDTFCAGKYLLSDKYSNMTVITPANGCLSAMVNVSGGLWGDDTYLDGFGKITAHATEYFGTGTTSRNMIYSYLKLGNCIMGSKASMMQSLGVNDVHVITDGISISPNPATNIVNISVPETSVQLAIYDMVGRVVRSVKLSSGSNTLSIGDMPPGLYLLRFSGNTINYSYKLLKN
ncbi:T9SS type A sorting domain-containing protein [Taibaiella soli]|uniref:Secretion system C-terminal sorting domain-containing protein n=1 Tax=Taibaiella soli TaxID=1649169 RepID=A0A2W2AXR1_9BACT|nr:T9SS type A sorting domain-containing protein [Taibaiella soli]PZF72458.1 hypothetical protein DN068_14000 [Taibaiella soli]